MEYQYQSKEELPPYLKAEQIAAYLGVSVGCVYTLLQIGRASCRERV